LSLIYNDFAISDSAFYENPRYLGQLQTTTDFVTIAYEPEIEKRNIVAFPTKGYYAGVRIQYSGFSSAKRINAWNLGILASAYQPAGERFFFATGLDAGVHNLNYESYIFDQAIGYGNYIRGFELYTINGNAYWLQKSSVNYNLIKTRTKTFGKKEKYHKFLKLHYAMYLSAFLDMGYVHSEYHRQSYQNTLLAGYGLGLNLVTYYDWVVRIEYSVSRYGENRVYLHSHLAF
jgi:outer membrane protein assembly factor BamA